MKVDQIKAGVILNYVVIVLNALVGLLYTPYLLRMLGQSEYGLYSLVSSVIAYLTILDLGFGSAVVRYTARFRAKGMEKEQYEMFGMFLILYIILGIIALFLGLALYFNVDTLFSDTMTQTELDRAGIMMLLLVFNLAITFPMSIFGSVIQAYEQFVFLKLVDISRIILTTIVMIVLLYWGYKALALVVVQTIFNFFTLFLHLYYSRVKIKMKFVFKRFNIPFLKEISKYSFWIFIMIIVDRIYWGTGQFVLGAMMGTVAVAIFAVAIQLHTMYQQFSTAMSSIFLPKVTAMVAVGDNKKEVSDLFVKMGRIQYIIMSFVLCNFIVFGKSFIELWAGKDYEQAFWMALLFLVPSTIPLVQNLGIVILQARNQMKFRSLCYIVIAMCSLILQVLFVKWFGIIGCSVAIAAALVIGQIVIMNIYYCIVQKIDIIHFWSELFKMSILPITFCIIGVFMVYYFDIDLTSWVSLGLWIVISSVIYAPLAYIYQMNSYERALFIAPINKLRKSY